MRKVFQLKEGGKITWEADVSDLDDEDIETMIDQIDQTEGSIRDYNA